MKMFFIKHSLHPPSTHYPIALWSISLLWDLTGLWYGELIWWQLSVWSIAAGLVLALPTIVTGFVEFVKLSESQKGALNTATRHMYVMMIATFIYAVSLMIRLGVSVPTNDNMFPIIGVSVLGFLFLQFGGWLGGELVYKYHVGLQDKTPQKTHDTNK